MYAFVKLALGIDYVTAWQPVITNTVTLVVMAVSIMGVLQSVPANRKIKCDCLGTVFNLLMSTVTIIEDGLMIIMSGIMLATAFKILPAFFLTIACQHYLFKYGTDETISIYFFSCGRVN